jgi:cytochrome c oxidase subunit 2
MRRLRRAGALLVALLIAASLAGCSNDTANALRPAGPAAARIETLWWLELGMGTVIFVGVVVFLLVGLFRRRRFPAGTAARDGAATERAAERGGSRIIVWAGIAMPTVVLTVVFGSTVATLRALATPEIPPENVVHVNGRQWWWEVSYPFFQFETANEIHIPVGEPVQIVLDAEDVIHSFWVPMLHGKLDLVPGQTNRFWIQADEAGEYWGVCAEYCGTQHAKMAFVVIAEERAAYDAWVARQIEPAAQPADDLARVGLDVFLTQGCLECHNVRGTQATGNLGPDLTHLASRLMLASGTVENNTGNLGGWVADPQHIKPGAYMPATDLTGDQLQALLAYLESLE